MANQQPETATTRHDFYLEEIEIENFRCFEHLKVALHPRMNVFVGANASGKTAFIESLSVALGGAVNTFSPKDKVYILTKDIRLKSYKFNIEAITPVKVNVKLEAGGEALEWKRSRYNDSEDSYTDTSYNPLENNYLLKLKNKVRSNEPNAYYPIMAYYSTERLWERKEVSFQEDKIEVYGTRSRGYTYCLNPGSLKKSFEDWFSNQELVELQKIRRGEKTTDSWELRFTRNMIRQFLPNCESIYYDVKLQTMIVEQSDSSLIPFSLLSDGQKCLLYLVQDISFRCTLLNPELKDHANETPGIVLIDEVDLHLHPGWQRQVLPGLMRVFPNIQFIVTTHSPQVLSSVQGECIFVLENFDVKKNSDGTVFHPFTQERDSNAILQDAFGVPVLEPQAEAELHAIYQHITDGDADGARTLLDKLILKRGNNDREVVRMETYLDLL